jgi:hypothetical protein
MNGNGTKYYGKYRGTVVNIVDPENRGRIQAIVPDVQGLTPTTWALPCVPIAGKQEGLFCIPQMGAAVWIEFEQGDADFPIWVGGFWGIATEVPALALVPPAVVPGQNVVIQTTGQNTLMVSDAAPTPTTGGIMLKSRLGAMIVVNDTGIYIQNGKGASITLVGPTTDINTGALTVV